MKPKVKSGGARLIAAGRHPVLLGPTAREWETLKAAAEAERRPVTQYVLFHALAAARAILAETPAR